MKTSFALGIFLISVLFGEARARTSNCNRPKSGQSTAANRDNFVNNCNYYKNSYVKKSVLSLPSEVDCNQLYNYYTSDQYDQYWEQAMQSIPEDKALLWSGTHSYATAASNGGRRYVVIGDTLAAYIPDQLGRTGDNMWQKLSEKFASSLSGVVRVLLGGLCVDVYDSQSVFAKNEVPNLSNSVSHLMVYIREGQEDGDYSCDNSNLDNLKNYLNENKKGITYSCIDDQKEVNKLIFGASGLSGASVIKSPRFVTVTLFVAVILIVL